MDGTEIQERERVAPILGVYLVARVPDWVPVMSLNLYRVYVPAEGENIFTFCFTQHE